MYRKVKKEKDEQAKKKREEDQYGQVLQTGGAREGLRDGVVREIDLSRILYQMVISLNPMQTATVLYNDVTDEFTYRIYRPKDGSVFEKVLTSETVKVN
jgi:hypothetical protein